MKTKRYLIFWGHWHYPQGGWGDFHYSFDSIEKAEMHISERCYQYTVGESERTPKTKKFKRFDWWHIVDSNTGKKIREGKIYDE